MKPIYEPLSCKEANLLLEEKAWKNISDDVFSNNFASSIKRRESWLRVIAFHALLFICYSLVITTVIIRYVNQKENLGPGLIYSKPITQRLIRQKLILASSC